MIFTAGTVDEQRDSAADQIEGLGDADSWTRTGSLVIALSQKPLDVEAIGSSAGVESVRTLRAVLPVLSRPDLHVPFNHASEMAGDLGYGAAVGPGA